MKMRNVVNGLLLVLCAIMIANCGQNNSELYGIWDSIEADVAIELRADGSVRDLGGMPPGKWELQSPKVLRFTFQMSPSDDPIILSAELKDEDLILDYGNGRKGYFQKRAWRTNDPGPNGVDIEGYITVLMSMDGHTRYMLNSDSEEILLRFMPGKKYVPLDGDGTPIPAEGVAVNLGKDHLYRCRGRIWSFSSLQAAYDKRGLDLSVQGVNGGDRILDIYEIVELR